LSLSGPTIRFTQERIAEFVDDLKQVAARISQRGFDHPLAGAA
jgi:DNA-binding IclR family transcriptional regulator